MRVVCRAAMSNIDQSDYSSRASSRAGAVSDRSFDRWDGEFGVAAGAEGRGLPEDQATDIPTDIHSGHGTRRVRYQLHVICAVARRDYDSRQGSRQAGDR